MKAISIEDRNPILVEQLVKVWKGSVKETHTFLSDEKINHIQEYVPQALREVPHLMIIEDDHGFPCAFMGINEHKLEMLFVSPEARGRGLGKKLIETGIREYSVNELGVNEQNPQAKAFYEHMGFHVYRRAETDEQGKPYPVLYMRLSPSVYSGRD